MIICLLFPRRDRNSIFRFPIYWKFGFLFIVTNGYERFFKCFFFLLKWYELFRWTFYPLSCVNVNFLYVTQQMKKKKPNNTNKNKIYLYTNIHYIDITYFFFFLVGLFVRSVEFLAWIFVTIPNKSKFFHFFKFIFIMCCLTFRFFRKRTTIKEKWICLYDRHNLHIYVRRRM